MLPDKLSGTAILIMERDDEDRKRIDSVLERLGLTTVNPDSCSEALIYARRQSTRLVVVDTTTPGLNYPKFLEELHQVDDRIGVVCLTGQVGNGRASQAQNVSRIPGCLERPFRRALLLATILEATEPPLALRA